MPEELIEEILNGEDIKETPKQEEPLVVDYSNINTGWTFASSNLNKFILTFLGVAVPIAIGLRVYSNSNDVSNQDLEQTLVAQTQEVSTPPIETLIPTETAVPTEIITQSDYMLSGEILFKAQNDHSYELYSLNPNNLDIEKIMNSFDWATKLDFFSNGNILFNRYNESNYHYDLIMFDRTTGEESELTNCAEDFEVSPNGNKILYLCTIKEIAPNGISIELPTQLTILDIESRIKKTITEDVDYARWMNDDFIMFSIVDYETINNDDYFVNKLYVINSNGEDYAKHLTGRALSFFPTPNNKIVAKILEDSGEEKHYLIDTITEEKTEIDLDFEVEFLPWNGNSWEWFGDKMVFEGTHNGEKGHYITNRNLDEITTLALGNINGFSWNPEGDKIVFSAENGDRHNYHLYVVNPDGTDLEKIMDTDICELYPVWLKTNN